MFKTLMLIFSGLMSIRDCGNGMNRAALLSFGSSPANPKAGDNVTLYVYYDLPAPTITGGSATYSLTLNGIPFAPDVQPLCTQTKCPIENGIHNETSWSIFPSGVSGKIVSQIEWHDQNDELVWCVETTWRV
jgi:hypothetical protein